MINVFVRRALSGTVRFALVLPVLVALAAAWPRPAMAADEVVVRVNGTEIRESDLKLIEDEIGANLPASTPEQRREFLITYVSDIVLVAQAAEAKKLDKGPDFEKKMAFARKRVLMDLLVEQVDREATTEAKLRKVYDETAAALSAETEVRARHILVETEDQAKDLAKQARAGGDFAELAKKNSKDPGSADGGDLGYFTKDQMVPEFAEAAFKTAKGQISDPVKTQFGWHVIKIEDQRKRQPPAFEEVREQIEQMVQRRGRTDLVTSLRGAAKIERVGAPAAPAPAAPEKK